jgi:hypothetical protein
MNFEKTSNEVIERWQDIKAQDILIYKVKIGGNELVLPTQH